MVKLGSKMIIFLLTFTMFLVGCSGGSYKILSGNVEFTKESAFGSYKEFTGHQFKSIELEKGSTISLNLEVKTEKGSLMVEILDKEDNLMISINSDIEEQEQSFIVESTGTYKIRVEGDEHKGEFKLDWNVNS